MTFWLCISLACFAIAMLFCLLLLFDTGKSRKRRGRSSSGVWDMSDFDCSDSCGSCGGDD